MQIQRWGRTKPPLGAQFDASSRLASGLINFWLLNEGGGGKATDLSGGGSLGTLSGATLPVWGQDGLKFDGSSSYCSLPVNSALNLTSTATFSAWIQTTTIAVGVQSIIADVDSLANNIQFSFEINRTAGKLGYAHGTVSGYDVLSSSGSIAANKPVHVAVVRSGSGSSWTVKFYINGNLDSSTTGTHAASIQRGANLGRYGLFAGNYFNGTIYQLGIWNRALSASEVAQLYLQPYAMMAAPQTRKFFAVVSAALNTISGLSSGIGQASALLSASGLVVGRSSGIAQASSALSAIANLSVRSSGTGQSLGSLSASALLLGRSYGVGQSFANLVAGSASALNGRSIGTGQAFGIGQAFGGQGGTGQGGTAIGAGFSSGIGQARSALSATASLNGRSVGVGQGVASLSSSAISVLLGRSYGTGQGLGRLSASALLSGSANGIGQATGVFAPIGAGFLLGKSSGVGQGTGRLLGSASLLGHSYGVGQGLGNLLGLTPTTMQGVALGVGQARASISSLARLLGRAYGIGSAYITPSPIVVLPTIASAFSTRSAELYTIGFEADGDT